MKVKKILSMLCAVSALSLCGCSGDLYEEDNIAEEYCFPLHFSSKKVMTFFKSCDKI